VENLAVTLRRYPDGVPAPSDFALEPRAMPQRGPGEVLIQTRFISLDPYVRGVIAGRHMGHQLGLGEVIVGSTVGQVLASDAAGFAAGDWVQGSGGWQCFWSESAATLRALNHFKLPPSTALGVLGMPGLTAYAGLIYLGLPKIGDTVVVSAAAGPVGATVGQLAKRAGARAVGIVGSDEKARLITTTFGFDAAINYKTENLSQALARECPDKIDVYFDNVGGATLEAVLARLNLRARVVLCGLITQYNDAVRPAGPNLGPVIGARAELKGLVVYDHFDKLAHWTALGTQLIETGALHYQEDLSHGLDQAPTAFARLMRGENVGKTLIALP
jgi:NADPH-dependent curcumin reductase CurA